MPRQVSRALDSDTDELRVPAAMPKASICFTSRETWRGIRQGSLRLLFVSPERLLMDGLIEALQGCISAISGETTTVSDSSTRAGSW
jgi:hypothetical protein